MAQLVDLTKYKAAIGETSTANDDKHTEALEDASAAVINYTSREFGEDGPVEDRTFRYDGSGFLEIDDATAVNTVKFETATLDERIWEARKEGPHQLDVFTYLELPPFDQFPSFAGEFGFEFNLDVFLRRLPHFDLDVTVNADWGFPVVPDDVQRATIYVAIAMEASSEQGSGVLASESVAEVARSFLTTDAVVDEPFPRAAQLLLNPYRRHVL